VGSIYLAPLFSSGGFRTWDCWLSPESIVVVRHRLWRMLRLSSWQFLGFPEDPQQPSVTHHTRSRVYGIERVHAVTVRKKTLSHNEVLVLLQDGTTDLYGIFDRSRIDEYRARLFSTYPNIYNDTGFDTTPIPTAV